MTYLKTYPIHCTYAGGLSTSQSITFVISDELLAWSTNSMDDLAAHIASLARLRSDDNTRSDSDIMPLGSNGFVTLGAEPTYTVEFAEGVNPEPPAEPEWTATPNTGVKKGTEVTVTYTGSKKVIGVKAEKKAATKKLTLTGKYYDYNLDGPVENTLTIEYTDNDTWKDIADRYAEVSLVDFFDAPEGKIVKFWGEDGCELKSKGSTYNFQLVSINDKVSAYSSYYLQSAN